jgi:hypothetical protein
MDNAIKGQKEAAEATVAKDKKTVKKKGKKKKASQAAPLPWQNNGAAKPAAENTGK